MFGQVVIGPPGSGKSTYCAGMAELLRRLGRRVVVVNLDPANDTLPYQPDIDLTELVRLEEVMDQLQLGPNGGLVYCMEYLEKNADWLLAKMAQHSNSYFLLDLPGQVELYTHDLSVQRLLRVLTDKNDYRLTCVHLVDSHYCTDAAKFIAVLLTSLSTMLNLQLPHVNVLSKADLIEQFGRLPFNVEYFTDVLDLSYLVEALGQDPLFARFASFNRAIADIIESHSLVSFSLLDIQDKESALRVLRLADQANGYVFGDVEERSIQQLMSCAVGAELQYPKVQTVQEKFVDNEEEAPEIDFLA